MVITTKSFGAAMLAGLLALTSVASVPATAYAASSHSQKNRNTTTTTTTTETTQATDTLASANSNETSAAQTAETPAASAESAQTVAKTSDPAGNNGTVKIDRAPFDSDPNNEPHVGCSFQVDFYGFDKGVGNANVQFELQPPTKDGRTLTVTSGDLTPNIGEDAAGGGTDVDAQETYTLKFTGAPHDKQGYHVKLTVHAPGSQGADTKYKVFWVQPCNDQNGHVLSTTDTKGGAGAVLPETMPSTGANGMLSTAITLIAAVATYIAAYRFQLRKLV